MKFSREGGRERETDRQTDGRTETDRDGQTDKERHRQTQRHRHRQTERVREKKKLELEKTITKENKQTNKLYFTRIVV